MSGIADLFFKIMSVLVIPLILWGVKLEVRNAVQDTEIAQLKKDLEEVDGINKEVQTNSKTLGRLEEKLNAANSNLKEIKGLLRNP
tara:strand:- start:394 stop:651 length:258 start_codon:yes stop_codon:yes gene_type:complete